MKDESSIYDAEPENLDRLVFEILGEPEGEEESGLAATVDGALEHLGGRIERYKLLSVLGEGGMGIVYLAQQKHPIRRQVALKVIKPGMDSKRIIARFEAERQALALLDHPNIAHVHDAGTTESGRPYFVMEYVRGLSIVEHCDRHKLTIEDRLNLFRQICLAVHHAHQKGIIHRDIKPSNILVSLQDDQKIPKIIDFGVAKAIAQPLTERTLATEESQLLGTPEYMSPEQADMASDDIDTRSDIYSLGVLLYVLLTGTLPFDSDTLRTGGIERIRQIIRETDPKTPSTRLTNLGEEAVKVSRNRRTDIATLAKKLHKELEWIPLKAMRKERAGRYRSASELADDIEKYRLKKFVRRNRALVTSVAAVLIVLIVGIMVSTILAIGQARARTEAQAVADFLRNDLLASVDPERGMGRDVTIRSFLDTASESLQGKFTNQPLVEASIRDTIGWTYRQLGELKAAETHLEHALQIRQEHLGEAHLDALDSVGLLAWLRCDQARYQEAAELLENAMSTSRHVLGDDHVRTLSFANTLGCVYVDLGRYDEAEQLYLKGVPTALRVLGEQHNTTLFMMGNLGSTYKYKGRYEDAEHQYLKTLRLREGFWDDENMWTLVYKSFLAEVYIKQKRYEEAQQLYLQILPIQRRVDGDDNFRTLRSVSGLALAYTNLHKYDESEKLFDEAMDSYQKVLGREHRDTLRCMNSLALLRTKQKRYNEAEHLFKEVLDGWQQKLGEDHPEILESKNDLVMLYIAQCDYGKAEPLLLEALEGRRLTLGDQHPHTLESWKNLIALYEAWNKPDEAEQWKVKLSELQSRP